MNVDSWRTAVSVRLGSTILPRFRGKYSPPACLRNISAGPTLSNIRKERGSCQTGLDIAAFQPTPPSGSGTPGTEPSALPAGLGLATRLASTAASCRLLTEPPAPQTRPPSCLKSASQASKSGTNRVRFALPPIEWRAASTVDRTFEDARIVRATDSIDLNCQSQWRFDAEIEGVLFKNSRGMAPAIT
jgi:hypothetical protein